MALILVGYQIKKKYWQPKPSKISNHSFFLLFFYQNSVSIEDAEVQNDLRLLGQFKNTSVILGSLRIARSRVESVQEIKDRLQEALKYIPAERLWVAPDCGLGYLPEEIAIQKLKNMVEATKAVA